MNREQLAWLAGFFDGEGYTGVNTDHRNPRPYHYPRIAISQNVRGKELLLRVKTIVGFGKVDGPRNYNKRYRPMYQYQIQGFEKVQAFIALIWEWLGPAKRAQAAEVLKLTKYNGLRPKGNSAKTHCKRGHSFNTRNTYHRKDRTGRECIPCRRIRAKTIEEA